MNAVRVQSSLRDLFYIPVPFPQRWKRWAIVSRPSGAGVQDPSNLVESCHTVFLSYLRYTRAD
jgi:hypothetical protein